MPHFVSWKSRMSALHSRRAILYLCLAIVIVFTENYEDEIRQGIGLGECDTVTLPVNARCPRFASCS
jgi:hypothetical protein